MVEYTGHDIYRMMRAEAQGTGSMDDGIAAVRTLRQALNNSQVYVSGLETELGGAWTGKAADAAWQAAQPIRNSFSEMADHIEKHDLSMRNQSQQFKVDSAALHDIPKNPPEKNFFDHASFFWDTDNEDAINGYNQKDQENKARYQQYMGATTNNTGDLPKSYLNAVGANSNVTITSAASSGGIPGAEMSTFSGGGGPAGGTGSTGGAPGGAVVAPGGGSQGGALSGAARGRSVPAPRTRPAPAPDQPGGFPTTREPAGSTTSAQGWAPSQVPPDMQSNRMPTGQGFSAGTSGSGGYGTPSGFGPAAGLGAGAAGGTATGMGARGFGAGAGVGAGAGSGGSGSGGTAQGAGGRLGVGAAGEPTAGQNAARGVGTTGAARGGTGMAGGPLGGGGARGEDDTEHSSPDYLVNEKHAGEIVGDLPPTAPPVIGE